MYHHITLFRPSIYKGWSCFSVVSRNLCTGTFKGDDAENGLGALGRIEEFILKESCETMTFEDTEENVSDLYDSLGSLGANDSDADVVSHQGNFRARQHFINETKSNAARILEILLTDGPGFDAKPVINDLGVKVSGLLVREVLLGILKTINHVNKNRCAKLGYKFFVWSGQQESYRHMENAYHIMLKIFAKTEEFRTMWRLVDEMIDKGYPITARTFNIIICACGEVGLARKIVEGFIKSKNFSYRPFKHSYNAILHSLLTLRQYKLIEWVYQQMVVEGHSPDVFTYNAIMCAKVRLGKLDHFHRLFDEMGRSGFSPDSHTFNLLLHVLGKREKGLAALKLLSHMKEVGVQPSVLHFTSLIDGFSRAGNMEACHHFFNDMMNYGCVPDVVCYTVMITGYVVEGELDKAQEMFAEMINKGQLPNVFTYNSMIRGLCKAQKFEEACSLFKEMETKGVNPNFLVYSTLVGFLQNAGRQSEAQEAIKHLVEKGKYIHLLGKIKTYRRL